MASFVLSASYDMHQATTTYGMVSAADASHIEIDSGREAFTYYGNFTYDAFGNVYGTWTGYTDTLGGVVLAQGTGLNVSASLAQQYINNNQLQPLFQLGLSGNDQFTVQPGIHVIDGYGGYNTVMEPLPKSTYTISSTSSYILITSAVSSDTLYNIQKVIFADGSSYVPGITITGSGGALATSDLTPLSPFSHVTIGDTNLGQTLTVTVSLSAPGNGALSNFGSGTYNATTGVYMVSGTPAAVSSSLKSLVFSPTVHQIAPGQVSSTGFAIQVSDTAGATALDNTTSVLATASNTGPASSLGMAAIYQSILQMPPTPDYASSIAAQIDKGSLTVAQYEASLLASPTAMSSVLPALIIVDQFYGVTPSSAVLSSVSATVQGWASIGMSVADQWSVLGMQFAHNGPFGTLYNALDNYAFAGQIYQTVFGAVPSATIQTTLANNVTALAAAYKGYDPVHSDNLGGKGALYAALLYYAENSKIGYFYNAANAFLIAQANVAMGAGTAATYAQSTELKVQFPSGIVSAPVAATATDPAVISISSSMIAPGPAHQSLQFLPSIANDTLAGATYQGTGVGSNTSDALNFCSLAAEVDPIAPRDFVPLPGSVAITTPGDAAIATNQTGSESFTTVVLQGMGGRVPSLTDQTQHDALIS